MGHVIDHSFGPTPVTRRLAAVAMLLALVAALLPAFGPAASAQEDGIAAGPVSGQTWVCPGDYTGSNYLEDCTPGGPFGVALTDPSGSTTSGETGNNGDFSFAGGDAGAYSLDVSILGEGRTTFYYACFDGGDAFLFDGSTSMIDFSLANGGSIFCRVYISYISIDAPSPPPSAAPSAPSQGTGTVFLGVFDCPVAYAGDDYVNDCTPTGAGTPLLYGPTVPLDKATASETTTIFDVSNQFGDLAAGPFSVAVAIPGEFADFYHYCFTIPSRGEEVFQFDGDSNTIGLDLADGATLYCRLFVIPEDLSGDASASPSVSPSATASVSATATVATPASARPSASSGAVATLPSTGTGDASGSSTLPLLALVTAALAAATVIIARRTVTSR